MEEVEDGLGALGKEEYEPSIAESNVRSVYSHTSNSSFDQLVKIFKEYQPKSTVLDINKLRNSPALKLKKFRESAYYGDIVNGKRHGQGVMLYQNQRVYEGNWQCDYKQGLGFQQFPNGSVYYGQYINGKPEGIGKYTWINGQFYQGQWVNGLKHGSGMWKGCKGDSYVGQWKMGKADGYGVHVWVNGDRYEGDFKACLKHGQGTQKFAKGDLYKGQYERGKPNGYGQYYWVNGSYFKGNFKQGLRHGHGMWKKGAGNSDKYEGEYTFDKKHGYGIFTWSTGNMYKGNYVEDLRSDFGQMYWSDGSYYKGQWKSGIQNGEGLLYVPGQGIKKGRFQNNQIVELFEEEGNKLPQTVGGHTRINQLPQSQQNNYKSLDGRRKINSSYDATKGNNVRMSRDARSHLPKPMARKQQSFRLIQRKKTHTMEMERAVTNGGNLNQRKQRIPHSAYYMHKLHQRVSTANNESNSHSSFAEAGKNRGEVLDELKSFTRKMVGRLPSRLSSKQN